MVLKKVLSYIFNDVVPTSVLSVLLVAVILAVPETPELEVRAVKVTIPAASVRPEAGEITSPKFSDRVTSLFAEGAPLLRTVTVIVVVVIVSEANTRGFNIILEAGVLLPRSLIPPQIQPEAHTLIRSKKITKTLTFFIR
jgi:hypothetical protein